MLIIEHIEDETYDVYDITVEDNHNFFANDILVHNCQEIALPTKGYSKITQLYNEDEFDDGGEVGMCSLAGITVPNIDSDEEYADVAYYCLLMIKTAIHEADYELPQIKYTATARNSAGVGIVGLAQLMAKENKSYVDDKEFIHEICETHYWHLVNASLKLSKEFGVAKWMNKTKWPQGWLPIDSYNKNVDSIGNFTNKRDWESLRSEIIKNGGIYNSVLVAHMPAESSSLSSGTTNGIYPIRAKSLTKSNDTDTTKWVVPHSEKYHYEIAWDIPSKDMIQCYGIIQKWTDQAISADLWKVVTGTTKLKTSELLSDFFMSCKYGMKSRYYINSMTSKEINLNQYEDDQADEVCDGCTI